jgi:outer membrane protein assembly factor BamB
LCIATSNAVLAGASVNVTQHHNNPSRDGLYIDPAFTQAAAINLVRDVSFSGTIVGNVYSQPLYVEGGPSGPVVIVATESNNVYALNATTGAIVWQRNVGTPVTSGLPCGNINPLGITATPIVDLASRSLFLNAEVTGAGHQIYSLNVDTGAINAGWPVTVSTAVPGFDSDRSQSSRAALGMVGNILYVPYGGRFGDCGSYRGRVVGVQINNPAAAAGSFATTATRSGIWGPGGIASDGTDIFVTTGNGPGGVTWNGSEAVIRLHPGPVFSNSTVDYFAPTDWAPLDGGDDDLGGSGPVLVDVPGATPSALVVQYGKDGKVYLLNRNNLGGVSAPVATFSIGGSGIQATAAYRTATGTYVVFRPTTNTLRALRITATSPPTLVNAWSVTSSGRGAPFVTSTDGTNNVVVWAVGSSGDQRLHGHNGDTGLVIFGGGGGSELMTGTRGYNTAAIAARGHIYVANDNRVYSFSVPTGPTPTPGPTASPTATPTPTATPAPTASATPTATPPCVRFNITINQAQEVPPTGSAATGSGTIDVDTVANTLSYNITFSGLGSAETMAHIHGFAPPGSNAGIIHNLPLGSPKIGVFNYAQVDEANILNGFSYVNIHSVNFPNGEIRGQIAGPTTPCSTPTPTATPSLTPTPTPVVTPTATPIVTPSPTPVITPTATPVTTPSATPVITPTATPITTPSPTPVITPTATPGTTPTATPIVTPTGTPGTTPTPGGTATPTPGGTTTPTPTPAPTAAQPLNLSTRMRVQTGDNVGIGGFIVTGSAPKHILLRAIGPSLASSVPDALADTLLELHGPGAFVTIANDNWRDDPDQEAAIKATGIPPTNDLEAAIDTTLNPGAYTAIISGKNNTTGAGLIEAYDLSQAVPAKLANISTRAAVDIGNNVVIAGFILGGNSGGDRVVLRGIGPSLSAGGVANALADPKLELRDGSGALLIANDNWQDDSAQAAEIIAAGLAPASPLESGIAATLPPGLYTALLAGVNDTSGVGLVEVYDRGAP